MIISFLLAFIAFNDTDNPKLNGYPFEKILTNSNSYIPDKKPDKIYSGLLNIEKRYHVKMVKFSSINENNKVVYKFNSLENEQITRIGYFNRNIDVQYQSEKFEDKDALGMYFFSKYNKNIENDLSKLGLSSSNYSFVPVWKRILSVINGTYFYIFFLMLVIIILKVKFIIPPKRITRISRHPIFFNNTFYLILILLLNTALLGLLWVYNNWSEILNFIFYYVTILLSEVLLVYLIYYVIYLMLNIKIFNIVHFKVKVPFLLIVQYFCSIVLYILLIIFSKSACELYLSFVHSPLKSISNYSTVDLSYFNSSFYIGDEKYNNDCKDFISKQENVILSAYNVGYSFVENNYDPYSGNSLLVSNNFFNEQTIKDNHGNSLKLKDNASNNSISIIIPNKEKNNTQKLKSLYMKWMNFLTNVPTNKLNVHILYSQDNQIIYSNAYQGSVQGLALKSPVIMVINPKALTSEESAAYLSNRFFWFTNEKKSIKQMDFDKSIGAVSKMKYLVIESSITWIFTFINLLFSIIFLIIFLIKLTKEKVFVIDRLIWSFISLITITIFLPTNFYSYAFLILIYLYLLLKDIVIDLKIRTKK